MFENHQTPDETDMDNETENWVRTVLLLLNGGHRLRLELLTQHHPRLNEYLAGNQVYTKGKQLKELGLISAEQFELLYPPINIDTWDIILVARFFKHCSGMTSLELSLIDAIQDKRREIFDKYPQMRMSNTDFTTVWGSIVQLLETGQDLLTHPGSKKTVGDIIVEVKHGTISIEHLGNVKGWHETEIEYEDSMADDYEVITEGVTDTSKIVLDAAHHGKLQTLEYIARSFPERLQETNDEESQAHHFAALGGQLSCLKYLIKQGLDPYHKDKTSGNTIMFKAIKSKDVWLVKYICETYDGLISERCTISGKLPIYAAIHSTEEVARCLVTCGVDVTLRDSKRRTVFHKAAYSGSVSFIKVVCEECSEDEILELKNARDLGGWTACHSAASSGKLVCLQAMVDHGFHALGKSNNGFTILHTASLKGVKSVVKYICETFPQLITLTNKNGETALHSAALGGNVECLKYLVQQRLRADDTSQYGSTLLHQGAFGGSMEMVRYICNNYEDLISIDTKSSETALMSAVRGGHLDILKYLIRKGIDPDKRSIRGYTILHVAAELGKTDIVRYLCTKYKTLIPMKADNDKMAVDLAIQKGHVDSERILKQK